MGSGMKYLYWKKICRHQAGKHKPTVVLHWHGCLLGLRQYICTIGQGQNAEWYTNAQAVHVTDLRNHGMLPISEHQDQQSFNTKST